MPAPPLHLDPRAEPKTNKGGVPGSQVPASPSTQAIVHLQDTEKAFGDLGQRRGDHPLEAGLAKATVFSFLLWKGV